METERVRTLLTIAGDRLATLPQADAALDRLRSLRSSSEFRAFLAAVPVVAGPERRRELAIAAGGPDWESRRDLLLRAAGRSLDAPRP